MFSKFIHLSCNPHYWVICLINALPYFDTHYPSFNYLFNINYNLSINNKKKYWLTIDHSKPACLSMQVTSFCRTVTSLNTFQTLSWTILYDYMINHWICQNKYFRNINVVHKKCGNSFAKNKIKDQILCSFFFFYIFKT